MLTIQVLSREGDILVTCRGFSELYIAQDCGCRGRNKSSEQTVGSCTPLLSDRLRICWGFYVLLCTRQR